MWWLDWARGKCSAAKKTDLEVGATWMAQPPTPVSAVGLGVATVGYGFAFIAMRELARRARSERPTQGRVRVLVGGVSVDGPSNANEQSCYLVKSAGNSLRGPQESSLMSLRASARLFKLVKARVGAVGSYASRT